MIDSEGMFSNIVKITAHFFFTPSLFIKLSRNGEIKGERSTQQNYLGNELKTF